MVRGHVANGSVGARAASLLVAGLSLLAAMLASGAVLAQTYPAKTIKLVVPFGPGGPTDLAARVVSQIVQAQLGQSMVIENRAGAGGATGSRFVAQAEPDGYTLLLTTAATLGALPHLSKSAGYDAVKSFAAVAKLTDSTTVLIVPPTSPAGSVAQLVAHAKANPGKLNYASAGVGNVTQLNAEMFKARAGIDVVHVPLKSGAEMATAIITGTVDMAYLDVSILLPLIADKKVKALGVTTAKRHQALPDLPTMAEMGWTDFVTPFWTGVHAPAGTPAPVVERLNRAINEGLKTAAIRELLVKVGSEPSEMTAQDFAKFVAAEVAKWERIVKLSGVPAQ